MATRRHALPPSPSGHQSGRRDGAATQLEWSAGRHHTFSSVSCSSLSPPWPLRLHKGKQERESMHGGAGRPQSVAWRRTRPGADRGALSSPVMAAAATSLCDGVSVSLRRASGGGTVATATTRGGRYLKYRPPQGPLYPLDGRCAASSCSGGGRYFKYRPPGRHRPPPCRCRHAAAAALRGSPERHRFAEVPPLCISCASATSRGILHS